MKKKIVQWPTSCSSGGNDEKDDEYSGSHFVVLGEVMKKMMSTVAFIL